MRRISLNTLLAGLMILVLTRPAYSLELDKAKLCILQEDYKSAITEGEKIMADTQYSPDLDELYYLLGISYLKDGNYLRASDIFEIILGEFKDSDFTQDALLGLGDAYYLSGEYDLALENYKELARHDYQDKFKPQAYYRISLTAAKLGRTEQAREYLEKLSREYPLNFEIKREQVLPAAREFYYSVQVGAFSNPENARKLLDELAQKGYPVFVEESDSGGGTSHKVRVGKLQLRSQAAELKERLSQEGYPTRIYP